MSFLSFLAVPLTLLNWVYLFLCNPAISKFDLNYKYKSLDLARLGCFRFKGTFGIVVNVD